MAQFANWQGQRRVSLHPHCSHSLSGWGPHAGGVRLIGKENGTRTEMAEKLWMRTLFKSFLWSLQCWRFQGVLKSWHGGQCSKDFTGFNWFDLHNHADSDFPASNAEPSLEMYSKSPVWGTLTRDRASQWTIGQDPCRCTISWRVLNLLVHAFFTCLLDMAVYHM